MKIGNLTLQEAANKFANSRDFPGKCGRCLENGYIEGALAARPEVVERLLEAAVSAKCSESFAGRWFEGESLYEALKAYIASIAPVGHDFAWAAGMMLAGEEVHHEEWDSGAIWARSPDEHRTNEKATLLMDTPLNDNKWHSGPKP